MSERTMALPYDRLGLKPGFLRELLGDHPGQVPWRIGAVHRGQCVLLGLDDEGGPIYRRARPPSFPIAVGDWIVLDDPGGDLPQVEAVLERSTWLRRGAGGQEGQQLLAANLDTVFVVAAFAERAKIERRALNARRLDRFVLGVREGGAWPVVLLNKTDLTVRDDDELRDLAAELTLRLGGVEVVLVSALERSGLEPLDRYLVAGDTVAFAGPSGVGKSSLVNALLGEERQAVGGTRERDGKGRHTTSRRELIPLPTGAWLIDTPGVREFAVVLDDDELAGFEDLAELAAGCRFTDCSHDAEPGCALREALSRGTISADRLGSWLALGDEARRLRSKHDAYARHLERKKNKRFGRLVREALELKKK